MLELWGTDDERFVLDFALSPKPFVKRVCFAVDLHFWHRASKHYLGQGLQTGVHAKSFALHASWSKSPDHRFELGLLECMLTGGFWCPIRVFDITKNHADANCPRCGCLSADALHVFLGM